MSELPCRGVVDPERVLGLDCSGGAAVLQVLEDARDTLDGEAGLLGDLTGPKRLVGGAEAFPDQIWRVLEGIIGHEGIQ